MASTFSIGGLSSGLDTKSIIDQLMSIERQPLLQLQKQQSDLNTRAKAVGSLKSYMAGLQTVLKNLADRSTINAKSATTDTPSTMPAVLTATASADAVNGSFKVTVSQLATSTRITSAAPLGSVVDPNAPLGSAGFRYALTTGTFSINGKSMTVNDTTTLNDVITAINGSGAGVTATLVPDADGRPNNRVQLLANPGQGLQLGSLADTSNVLRLLNLSDAVISGYTAATTNSGASAVAGALNTSVTINGVTTAISQSNAGFDASQNAQFIASAINGNSANTVTAQAQVDGTITLVQKTAGSQQAIDVSAAGVGTGLAAGTTQNGTDRAVSTTNLGMSSVGDSLASARLTTPIAGLDGSGNGAFKLNGVNIAYKSSDTIATVLNRINASSAGVSAMYDPVQDRIRLSASQTGARIMTLEDVQGNFLTATGLLGAQQSLGQNAIFSIDSVNGGAPLSSATNSVTGYLPGVTFDLKSVSASPVTVTVAQNPQATIDSVKGFVDQFNSIMQQIEDLTKYDTDKKQAALLTGDTGITGLQQQLRSMVTGFAVGAAGKYTNLMSIGVSFGAVGSSIGSTNRIQLDQARLTAAIADNPQAVEQVLASFSASLGAPTGTNVTGVSGTPRIHEDGTYHVKVDDATNKAHAWFVTTSGQTIWTADGQVTPGQDNYSLIPGLKLTIPASVTVGAEDTFSVSVTNKGIGVKLSDFTDKLLGPDGFFASRKEADDSQSKALADRVAAMERRLSDKEDQLNRKFAVLETTMARLQSQGNSLAAQFARMNAPSTQ
ncbi:MAG: flagellar filament capping protein FliD [Chloroflexi bacterium]|nr:flagellar filament capping protein FliD [Chloroflexota bacterium]